MEVSLGLLFYNARYYDPLLGRFIQADTIVPGGDQGLDRYAYVLNNPVKYTDPTGYFSEDQIKQYFGFEKDDSWEEVLKLFQNGGKYEGRWGWLETLRRAEVGDQITIDWMEGIPGNGKTLPNSFTFDLDANGNLILTGDGIYFDAELAGLYGNNYKLTHYTDLSDLCSPLQCRYTTEFSTSAIHDPYLHTKILWGNLVTDMPGAVHIIEMGGITIFTGGLTVADVMAIGTICAGTGPACIASVITLGPAVPAGIIGTIGLARGTYDAFMAQFSETTP